jgi:hypothetical protein
MDTHHDRKRGQHRAYERSTSLQSRKEKLGSFSFRNENKEDHSGMRMKTAQGKKRDYNDHSGMEMK